MHSIIKLEILLTNNNCDYKIITHDTPIISTQDAAEYFDINKAAPTFIIDTDKGLISLIISSRQNKIDFKAMKNELGFSKFRMADREKVRELTGFNFSIPPLKQTLNEVEQEFENGVFLNAVDDHDIIIGSVRAYAENGTLHIGKLIVHPNSQGQFLFLGM